MIKSHDVITNQKGVLSGHLENNATISIEEYRASIRFTIQGEEVKINVNQIEDDFFERFKKGSFTSFIYETNGSCLEVKNNSVVFSD